jgi:hypothetical protein
LVSLDIARSGHIGLPKAPAVVSFLANFSSLRLLHWLYGYLIPSLHHWGILFTFILILDLPISLVAYLIGWKYGGLALAWIMVVGTLWWYLLGRGLNFCLIHSSVVLDRLLFSCPTQKSAQQTTTSPDQGANQTGYPEKHSRQTDII